MYYEETIQKNLGSINDNSIDVSYDSGGKS